MVRSRILQFSVSGLIIFLGLIYVIISVVLSRGVTTAEREPITETPEQYDVPYKNVLFQTRNEDTVLAGWHITVSKSAPTIIFVHGLGSNRSSDGATHLASRLWKNGFNSLLFDLRGHGTSDDGLVSGGYYEQNDLLGAFDFLVQQGVPSNTIGVLGFSLGAGIAILGASKEPGIRALVADTPYANVTDLITQEVARTTPIPEWIIPVFIPGTTLAARLMYGIRIGQLTPETYVGEIDYPIYVIHGEDDTRIPFEHAVRVHQSAHPASSLWIVPNIEHVDAFTTLPKEYTSRVTEYFRMALKSN